MPRGSLPANPVNPFKSKEILPVKLFESKENNSVTCRVEDSGNSFLII